MEYPEEQYYRVNRILLSLVGLWPYDNNTIRRILVVLMILLFISYILVQLLKLVFWEYNLQLYLKMLSLDLLITQWNVKYLTFYAALKNIKKLRECMRSNWSILKDNIEIEMIRTQANTGRKFTIAIAVSVGSAVLNMIFIQNSSFIVMPLNESRSFRLLNMTGYFVNQQRYIYISTLQTSIEGLATVIAGIATETFSLSSALHAFAMFKITSYRIRCILNENDRQKSAEEQYGLYHDRVAAAVDIHNRAIEFSNLLVMTLGIPYLFMFTISVISASIYLFSIFTISLGPLEIIGCVLCTFCHFLFLIVGNFVGQEFINCDMCIYEELCNVKWYNSPLKTQKLILFMMQNNTRGYKVDAGGLFSPSLKNLTTTISIIYTFVTMLCATTT